MLSIKESARLVYLEEQRRRGLSDQVMIHDGDYNSGSLTADGTTNGVMGSQFEYLWNFYQGYKRSNPSIAAMTVMAGWERKARWCFWKFWRRS